MSRIGKKPVLLPQGVSITKDPDGTFVVKGPKGELKYKPNPLITVTVAENEILVTRDDESREKRALHGLTRSLLQNMVIGVTQGYSKQLEINGVGYKAQVQGTKLVLNLGYSHPIDFPIPAGITIKFDEEKKNLMTISGIDKALLGEVAAKIRSYREPEPYKGKGIKYTDEHIRRKAGKAATKAAA
ncbi:MAG: 50S ribosomal protein L6 [Candidatus Gracilibacteria bacterium]|jgi:large subunit ribosomal protein L6